jgi:hypothetical protein
MPQPSLLPELLDNAPLRFAPTNEMGVVFLFSHLCRKMQMHVELVQSGFPDCVARQRVGGKEKLIRIEFEYRSSNFRAHRHPVDGCDWIVCWEHDWADVPKSLRVVELRQYYGRGFNVWVAVGQPQDDWPAKGLHVFGKRVAKGDLVFFYEASPKQSISQVYCVADEAHDRRLIRKDRDPRGKMWQHTIRRVCTLDPPLPTKALRTRTLQPIFDAALDGTHNRKLTEQWWLFYDYLIRKYPECASAFDQFAPSQV